MLVLEFTSERERDERSESCECNHQTGTPLTPSLASRRSSESLLTITCSPTHREICQVYIRTSHYVIHIAAHIH